MLLGTIACVVGVFLPWNYELVPVDTPGGGYGFADGDPWNGLDQMTINMDNGRFYGALMLVAFVVALVACVGSLVAAIGTLTARDPGRGLGVLALISAILGILATLGTIVGYLALGATHEMALGVWVFGLSFIPVLIGSIGVLARKY